MLKYLPFLKALSLLIIVQVMPLQAAELRTWTSVKGLTIKAKLLELDDQKVELVNPEGKKIQLKVSDLSLADRTHLVEYAEADESIITDIKLQTPEKDLRLNRNTMEALDKKMGFGDRTDLQFNLFQSEHFFIASTGKFRAKALAETAERLWHGMAFQYLDFREKWGDKRKVIIVTLDDDIYRSLGKWYSKWLFNNILDRQVAIAESQRNDRVWMEVDGTTIRLPEAQQKRYNCFGFAKVFRIKEKRDRRYTKVFSPYPTHSLASMLISDYMGGVSKISPKGSYAITTGHAYYKEIQLGGKAETQLLDAKGSGASELTKSSGWEDGRSWARGLKRLVRKGDIEPSFTELLNYDSHNLTPERLVLLYSFAYYVQSDPARQAKFAKMLQRVESNHQIPKAIEIARIFEFDSIKALEKDWTEFIESSDFK